jgi:hypothetical protein
MYNYFIIFKPKGEVSYRLYTTQIFTQEKDGTEFAFKSIGKKVDYKVVEYNKENIKEYWPKL